MIIFETEKISILSIKALRPTNKDVVSRFQDLNAHHPSVQHLFKDVDVVIYFGFVPLRDAFGNPDNVSTFLFLQFNVSVENTEVELLHKRVDV